MSIWSPESPAEVARAGWIFVALLFAPLAVFPALWWHVYMTPSANVYSAACAGILGVPATWIVLSRGQRLASLGLHPYYGRHRRMGAREFIVGFLGIFLSLYAWATAAVFLAVWMQASRPAERTFAVSEAKQCTSKCLGCSRKAKFVGWPGISVSPVCVEGFRPDIVQGERVVVKARFSAIGVYVESINRASAIWPPYN
jgi:hypothetical protein